MKGIYFNLLEAVVTRDHGEVTWDALLEAAGLDGAYTSLGSYSDDDLMKLVAAASSVLGITPEAVLRWVGREALPLEAERFPSFFSGHVSAQSFILTLNDMIHPEVRKLYPGADVPDFEFLRPSEETLQGVRTGTSEPAHRAAVATDGRSRPSSPGPKPAP